MRITTLQLLLSPIPLICWLIASDKNTKKVESLYYFWTGSLLALLFPLFPTQSIIGSSLVILWYLSSPIREKIKFFLLRHKFRKEFPATLINLATVVKAGAPISAAIQYVAKRSGGMIRKELDFWTTEFNLSGSSIAAIKRSAKNWNFPTLTILATTIAVSTKSGGTLAPYLEEIATSLKNELKNEERVRTLTLTARLQGYITIPIPIFTFFIMRHLEPAIVNTSMSDPGTQKIYLFAFFLQLVGGFWIIYSGRRR